MKQSKNLALMFLLGAVLVALHFFPPVEVTPPPADAPPELLALTGASVLIGAGMGYLF